MNKRKQTVLFAAQRLFSEKGFMNTSIQDILEKSNISKGTFYNYFSSKNECIMAILEHGRDEVNVRRKEILVGQDPSSKKILIKQIVIRLEVNREYNLFPIYQAIYHSGDPNLKTFINKYQMKDLAWLTNRLIDVYGKDSTPFAPDLAVILHGIVNHMIQAWRTTEPDQELNAGDVVNFAVRRLDSIADNMIETKDIFLGDKLFLYEDINIKQERLPTEQLLIKLNTFTNELADEDFTGKQFSKFLIGEIQSELPRIFLLESVIQSFRNVFIGTTRELEAREIAANTWKYIDILKKETK